MSPFSLRSRASGSPSGLRDLPLCGMPPIAEEGVFDSGYCDVAVSRYHPKPTILGSGSGDVAVLRLEPPDLGEQNDKANF